MAQELEFGSRLQKRKDGLKPISMAYESMKEYKAAKIRELKPVVLNNPQFSVDKNEGDDTEDEIDEGEGSRGIKVAPRNPKLVVYDPEAAKDPEERWANQYIASTGWLRENIPFEDSSGSTTGFVHGDLRIDNLVFHPVDNLVFHPVEGNPWPLVGRKFYIAFSFFRGASILAGVHNSEDDSMDDIGEIPILLEWNHEFQFCWNHRS
ncbi:unnamed protein product [Lactuca virosa]|uniref:Aminoglycoside phosphotransferase domain-containing protein n=1 Tax=Lactuca virosa TaxID=75947 RepID=A0AAU9PJN0_9ASTR|nr:unnamed protein product [Lactuca virosa]